MTGSRFQTLGDRVAAAVAAAELDGAQQIAEAARALAPVAAGQPHAGALRAAIAAHPRADGTVTVGVHVDDSPHLAAVAGYIELGTSRAAARPFLFPAAEQMRGAVVFGVAAAVKQGVRGGGT